MKFKAKLCASLLLIETSVLGTRHLLANGSAWETGIVDTGGPATASDIHHSTNVAIEEENLTIDLHQEFAAVEVRYRMHNTGGRAKQDCYFPVESWTGDLQNYRFTADGKELIWQNIAPPVKSATGDEPQTVASWLNQPIIHSWKKSVIPFASNQTREIVIRYNAYYGRQSGGISDDINVGDALFAYSLSPAATWKGPIGKGKVVINIVHPEPWDVSILKPKQRFTKINETRYEWDFENLKPSFDDDIKIAAHRGFESFPVNYAVGMQQSKIQGQYVVYDDRYYLVHRDYDAVASSTLKPDAGHNYDVRNIRGDDPTSETWAEGVPGDGIGESITMKVKRPLPLDAILIIPGYGATRRGIYNYEEKEPKEEPLWGENNRVAQLEITLNDEHAFTADIPDEIFHDPYPVLVRGYSKPVEKIKMVIEGVHRGTQFRDTCISLVELRAKLSKKPKMGPCR